MKKEIYFAGGCFWGVEEYFSLIEGVTLTSVGYANGTTVNPSYEDVTQGNTGHAETVRVVYDPARVGLKYLLALLYEIIDPTSLNKQGNDRGTQYRSGIYYTSEDDLSVIKESIAELQKKYDAPIVIEVKPLEHYYPAEEYHQKYLKKNPRGYCHIGSEKFKAAAEAKPKV